MGLAAIQWLDANNRSALGQRYSFFLETELRNLPVSY